MVRRAFALCAGHRVLTNIRYHCFGSLPLTRYPSTPFISSKGVWTPYTLLWLSRLHGSISSDIGATTLSTILYLGAFKSVLSRPSQIDLRPGR